MLGRALNKPLTHLCLRPINGSANLHGYVLTTKYKAFRISSQSMYVYHDHKIEYIYEQ